MKGEIPCVDRKEKYHEKIFITKRREFLQSKFA